MTPEDKELIKMMVEKKFKTTMIAPIGAIEDLFGHLWGEYEHDEGAITERHRQWEKLFVVFRKRVLDNGNEQMRNLFREIDSL